MTDFVVAEYMESSYTCPNCGVFAQMHWLEYGIKLYDNDIKIHNVSGAGGYGKSIDESRKQTKELGYDIIGFSYCHACKQAQIWLNEKMIYPSQTNLPLANPDMPAGVKEIYNEAKSVFSASPRAAAALLRLALQQLCKELGEEGKNINTDIRNLVAKGLKEDIQKALDIIRVVGNNAVHPGEIDLNENKDVAMALFNLINIIVDEMITSPNKISKLYNVIPENLRNEIDKRDKRTK